MNSPTQLSGLKAEKIAREFLKNKGLKLITKNFRTTLGELDLIMEDEKTLIFVEVRNRRIDAQVSSMHSVDRLKQKKIIKTALVYLQKNPTWKNCRFDVVAIHYNGDIKEINWIKDAFQVE